MTRSTRDDDRAGLSEAALDTLFRAARSYNAWLETPVSDAEIRSIYDLVKWGPTSANSSPARFIFIRSSDAKERLLRHVEPGNVAKTRSAPVTVIVGHDLHFFERLPALFPHQPAASGWYSGDAKRAHAADTAFRNGTLQGAYMMLAARAIGLDCGPMSGFDRDGVDRDFWAGTPVRTNFLCNLGHGAPASLFPRHPRLSFDEACEIQ
jgi:3-hydroxypropanoate dehydrogenase